MKKLLLLLSLVTVYVHGAGVAPLSAQDLGDAASSGNIKRLKQILHDNPELINAVDQFENSALMRALLNDQIGTAEVLIMSGADIDYRRSDGNTVLMLAVIQSRLPFVEFLLNHGADITVKNNVQKTAYDLAVEKYDSVRVARMAPGKRLSQEVMDRRKKERENAAAIKMLLEIHARGSEQCKKGDQ